MVSLGPGRLLVTGWPLWGQPGHPLPRSRTGGISNNLSPLLGFGHHERGLSPCTAQGGGHGLGTAQDPQGGGQSLRTAPCSPRSPQKGTWLEAPLCKAQSRGCWWPKGLTQAMRGCDPVQVATVPQDTAGTAEWPLPVPVCPSVCQSMC